MADRKPYEPPTYGVRNLAIERRIAGKPPASVEDDEDADVSVKAEAAPANKARKAAPANKGKK